MRAGCGEGRGCAAVRQAGRKRRDYDLEAGRVATGAASDAGSDDGPDTRLLPRGMRGLSQVHALRGAPPRAHYALLQLDRFTASAGAPAPPPSSATANGFMSALKSESYH